MKRTIITLLVLSIAAHLSAQNNSSLEDAPKHFLWSERSAHELDYSHTIRTATDLTPTEKKALLNAVLVQLKRQSVLDKLMFEGITERQLQRLAADTRIKFVDLSGKGSREVIAQANGLGPCGGTGNCIIWVFQLAPDGVKLLLDSAEKEGAFEVLIVRPWFTNGYRDIVLGTHDSASDRSIVWYKFSNGGYRRSSCYNSTWMAYGQPLNSPNISWRNCKDLFTPQQ